MARIRVLDFESTGPSPAEGGLCEIGYCDLEAQMSDLNGDPTDWQVIGGKGRLCHPGGPITPETQAIHHIDDSDVEGQPNWKPLLRSLLQKATEDGVVAYAAYGAEFEQLWMHPEWLGDTPLPMIDVHKIGLRVWEDKPPHHSNRALQYWRKPVGLNRDDALPNHRAYPDALVTAYLLRDLLNDEGTPVAKMIAWSLEPALTVRCYVGDWRNGGKGTPWPEVETSMLEWILSKGFQDKPDIRFTAAYHLEKRRAAAAEQRELADLNDQFSANGMEGISAFSPPATSTNQAELAL